MSLLLLFRPYRWVEDDAGGDGGPSRSDPFGRKSRIVFKVPRLGVKKKLVIQQGKQRIEVEAPKEDIPWQVAFSKALDLARNADISRTLDNIGSTEALIERLENNLAMQDLTADEHIIHIHTLDPLLVQQLAIITAHLALLPTDDDLLLAYMVHRNR